MGDGLLPYSAAQELEMALRLLAATILGAVIGLERERRGRPAGLRTLALVSLGSAGFTVVSAFGFLGGDPGRVASGVVTGIGFLGAGSILREGSGVTGVTTAASIWAVAALGMLVGAGLYILAISMTLLILIVLWVLARFEDHR
ncbi:MAG: MgtC/SapB family protein [Dehalococcoidia bacterium]